MKQDPIRHPGENDADYAMRVRVNRAAPSWPGHTDQEDRDTMHPRINPTTKGARP